MARRYALSSPLFGRCSSDQRSPMCGHLFIELKKNVPPGSENDMIVYIVGTKVDLAYHERQVRPDRARVRLAQWFPPPRTPTPPGSRPPPGSRLLPFGMYHCSLATESKGQLYCVLQAPPSRPPNKRTRISQSHRNSPPYHHPCRTISSTSPPSI